MAKAKSNFLRQLKKQRQLVFLIMPFVILAIIIKYVPVWGWTMAFQNYKPSLGILHSEWVGLKQFKLLFSDENFFRVFRNTLVINVLKIGFGLIVAAFLAILINEVKLKAFKKTVQTISYLPHFISWAVAAGMIMSALSVSDGIVNDILVFFGIIDKPVLWLINKNMFWGLMVLTDMWKEAGWSAIIFLAAITNIDPCLYEASTMDGANRIQNIRHITLPLIMPTMAVLSITMTGWVMTIGFEQIMLLQNATVLEVSEIFPTFIIKYGLGLGRYSYATAIGIFSSGVSIILVVLANMISKKYNYGSLF